LKTSLHNLSHTKAFSGFMGSLMPIGWKEVLPGDHFQHSTTALIRTQPLLAPIMHRVNAKIFHFFVPNRLIWDNWQDFITGGPDGNNASIHPFHTIIPPLNAGSIYDFMGVPPIGTPPDPGLQVSALPFRAYNLIYNQYFRDQDLVDPLPVLKSDGADNTDFQLLAPAWKKDYFTLARPEPMKGPDVTVPVQGVDGTDLLIQSNSQTIQLRGQSSAAQGNMEWSNSAGVTGDGAWTNGEDLRFGSQPGLRVDTSLLEPHVTALDFREAFAQLRFQELRSRFGSEYVDYLAFLGVKSSDSRLQRAEYLGGGAAPIQFSEVLQTAPEDSDNPVGAMKGHGITAKRSNRYRRFFEEHGIVMSLLYVAPDPVYSDGVDKSFLRKTKEDYWQPEYEHIGQQPIQNQEVYAQATEREGTFGWIDRYEEYRHSQSTIAGEFRTTLDYWTMARQFDSEPALNEDFILCNPTNRVWPAPSANNIYIFVNHNLKARRLVTNKPKGYTY